MSDYNAPRFGLPDQSPFAILARPRADEGTAKAPGKRGPKPSKTKAEQSVIALETPVERNRRHSKARKERIRAERIAKNGSDPVPNKWNGSKLIPAVLKSPAFAVRIASQEESRKTNAIGGRL